MRTRGRALRAVWSARVRALLAVGALAGIGVAGTTAEWTDSATATATLSTGTIDLRLGAAQVDHAPGEITSWTLADMVPGSTTQVDLQVRNIGTYPFTYGMTSSATGGLAGNLRLSVFATAGCTGSPTVVTDAALGAASFADRPLTGSGGGAASETLCLRVTLPAAAPTGMQGQTATATLTFTATT